MSRTDEINSYNPRLVIDGNNSNNLPLGTHVQQNLKWEDHGPASKASEKREGRVRRLLAG